MIRSFRFALVACLLCLLTACQASHLTPNQPAPQLPAETIDQLPAPGSTGQTLVTRAVSDVPFTLDGWSAFGNYLGNVSSAGSTAILGSTADSPAAAWFRVQMRYGPGDGVPVPYIAPYQVTIHTGGGDEYWVALGHFTRGEPDGYWRAVGGPYTDADLVLPIGLEPNASWVDGLFYIAVITAQGVSADLISIDFLYPDAPPDGEPVVYRQWINTEDGTRLATTVYLPLQETDPFIPDPPYPVLLLRTPYPKDNIAPAFIANITQGNVIVMLQYFRGRLEDTGDWPDSDGNETLFRDHIGPTHTDAIDTVDWIEQRLWYNGDLFLSGPSALGLWTYQAATALGNRITGIYPQISSGNIDTWAARRNGCFKRSNIQGWLENYNFPTELLTEAEDAFVANDDAYWAELDMPARADQVTCPGWHEAGWWDVDVESTIGSWRAFNENGGIGAAGQQWLVLGPWSHDSQRGRTCGSLQFPATFDANDPGVLPSGWDPMALNGWAWDKLGRSFGYSPPANHVLAYFVGEESNLTAPQNHWYEFATWPPSYTEQTLYLTDTNTFSAVEPAAGTVTGWGCDPANPLPTLGGANLPVIFDGTPVPAGPIDQAPLGMLPGFVSFRTAPFLPEYSIAGPIRVVLHVSTTALMPPDTVADTDIMVKLIDEYPGGLDEILVADSAVRLSWYLAQQEPPQGPVVEGLIYEVEIEVGQRAYVFGSGHVLRVDITSSNYPRFDVNPGNGDAFYDGANGVIQANSLYTGLGAPSRLILPQFDPSV